MKKIRTSILATIILFQQGCAHTAQDKKLDEKISQETPVNTRAELNSEARQLIKSSPDLSPDQRSKLLSLQDSTRKQTDEMRAQSLKLRAALIKDLIATHYDDDEVTLIKSRIKKLEDQRLAVLFKAVEQAKTILGHQASQHQPMIREFLYEPHAGHFE